MNQSFAALLHAKGTVNELSVLNIVSKLVWGVGTLLAVVLKWPLWPWYSRRLLVSEALKTIVARWLVQQAPGAAVEVERAGT
jgi:hypothetical protein